MANIERATEREFGIYCVSQARFMNLDFIGLFDENEYLTNEVEQTPTNGLFTLEECSRWVIHQDDRTEYKIINCKNPRYLVDFELAIYRKQRQEKLKTEQVKYQQEQQKIVNSQKVRTQITSAKQSYFNSLQSWKTKLNSENTQRNGTFGKVLKEQPKMQAYALVIGDFTAEEKVKLANDYKVAGL